MGRIFVIGDIHGCLDKAQGLVNKIPIKWDRDILVLLGDYVDRGDDPAGVIQFLIELSSLHPDRVKCLKGNHEVMFLDFLNEGALTQAFLSFGGKTTLSSYGIDVGQLKEAKSLIPRSHLDFLKSLRTSFETEKYFMVHAGLKPGVPIHEQKEEDMLWIRHKFINSDFDWGKRIIFGHTPVDTPLIQANKIGIDTGAVYGGRLTCLILPEIEFIFE